MMKLILILTRNCHATFLLLVVCMGFITGANAQIVCATPETVIYGLTGSGAIYPINVSNASLGTVVKNTTYPGNSPNKANGLAYNSTNGKFYYFKRNVGGSSPIEFVSYDPATATVTVLSTTTTCLKEVHTGCITADGLGYYTVDTDANLCYYNIVTNTWTFITSTITDQNGNNVSDVIRDQSAGDIAFDGNGNLWFVTSNSSNYGVYCLLNPPKTTVAGVTVYRRVNPSTATPSNNSIAGIAFNPSGQIFMATKNDNRLYRLENNLSTTFIGTFSVSDVGNDLTSCVFPLGVLPITWMNFSAALKNEKEVKLSWQIAEKPYAGFKIQYSHDGKTWSELAFVTTKDADTEGQEYSFTHANPSRGQNYYRIITLNELGRESYSEINAVFLKGKHENITIWPNPASGYINISSDNYTVRNVMIFDLAGRMHLNKQVLPGNSTIPVSSLKSGNYLITVHYPDGTKQTNTFIKQ